MSSAKRRRFLKNTVMTTVGLGTAVLARAADDQGPASRDPTWLVVYSPGPKWLVGKPLSEQQLRPHGAYMLSLFRNGALRWAGGFADNSGGAAAFTAPDAPSAQRIVEDDPAVADEIFTFVLRRWNLVDWAAVDERSAGAPRARGPQRTSEYEI